MSESTVSTSPPSATKARSRPRRLLIWTLRGLVAFLAIALLIIIATAIVLKTDYPRRIVVDQLQKALGLRVESATMEIDWTGHTVLRDVKISLPLAQNSFLDVPELDAVHTSLPMIVVLRNVELKAVTFHNPTMQLVQDNAGHWNVADAIDLITRAGGKSQADQSGKPSPVVLPAVTVEDGVLKLIDRQGRTATIQPLELHGQPDGPLVWKFDAHVNDQLALTGQISPGGLWEHELTFNIAHIDPWLSPWVKTLPNVQTTGNWRGRVDGPQINGRLQIEQLAVGAYSGHGIIDVQRDAGGIVTASPEDLFLQTHNDLAPEVHVRSGSIQLSGTTITASALSVGINGGEAKLDGNYSWADNSASLSAAWHDIAIPQAMKQRGTLAAKLTMPWPGAPHIEAHVSTLGTAPAGNWTGQFDLVGNGRSWSDIDWTAKVAQAGWTQPKQSLTLTDLVATITQRPHLITLQNLTVTKGGSVAANGQYNLDEKSWNLNVSGQNFSAGSYTDQPVAIEIHASGQGPAATLKELSVKSGDIEVHANGSYDSRLPKPVGLNVSLAHLPALQGTAQDALIRGNVRGDISLNGTLSELGIVKGTLFGSDVYFQQRKVGDLAVQISGTIQRAYADQPARAEIETTEAQILGGAWRFHATWPQRDGANNNQVRLHVAVHDLPLSGVGDLTHVKNLSGNFSGAWTIDSPIGFDRNHITVQGNADLRDIALRQFHASQITAQTAMQDGKITLDPIKVQSTDGAANLHVDLAIAQPTLWNIKADVVKWKLKAPGAAESASVSVQTNVAADVLKQTAVGTLSAQSDITLNQQTTGTAKLQTDIDGRTINLKHLEVTAFGGKALGGGIFSLDDPLKSTGHVAWNNFDASQLVNLLPQTRGLAGMISGTATLAPSVDPRALAPLKLAAVISIDGGHYRTIQIGSATLTGYLSTTRAILDQFTMHVAGGVLNIWGRTAEHDDIGRSTQLQIDFNNLDLDQLAAAAKENNPDAKPIPGKLHGSIVLVGSIADRDHLFGQGNVDITESDLLNVPGINALYGIMHIGESRLAAHGNGSVNVRLENSTLHLDELRYFNQGTEIRASATVHEIWKLPESPIDGNAVGSAQPLKNVKLPYFADVNRIFTALQGDLTPVKIHGLVKDPKVDPIPFNNLGEGMKAFILGDVKGEE